MRLAYILPFFVAARRRIQAVGQVDRVIGHWIIPAGVPLLVDHPAPLEVVAHGADVRLLCALPRPVRNAIVTTLLDRSTRFRFVARASLQTLCDTLPSNHAARLLDAAYVEPAAMDLPDVRDVHDIRLSNDASSGGFVVAVGRLLELKRFDLAITAAASANVPIVIIGGGPLRTQLGDVARATGARATFLGLLPRTKTLAWIAAARVLVHPSRAEGAPTVVREARALGVPVVATASGDLEEWARDDPGIAIVEPTTKSLGAAIVTAFRSRTTPEPRSVQ
jgi:glycosyltransferase involved in cell wall biosynthesis